MLRKPIVAIAMACLLWPVFSAAAEEASNSSASLPSAQQAPKSSPLSITSTTKPLIEVNELLRTMAEQRKNLNYEGSFTYQNNTGIEGFKLQHWIHEGSEFQRLYHLNGIAREAIVEQSLDCMPVGEKIVLGRLDNIHNNLAGLSQYYTFTVRGFERVAGRVTTVLQVVPKDSYRFGYFFSIDRETGLLLKSLLLDENQRVVEQFQFLELNTNIEIAELSAASTTKLSHRVSADELAGCGSPDLRAKGNWSVAWLPEGFEFTGLRKVQNDIEMLMYTDGLSTFSIFIDPIIGQVVIEGRAQRGATNFYMGGLKRGSQTYQLTIVGEIPSAVTEQLAQSIRTSIPTP